MEYKVSKKKTSAKPVGSSPLVVDGWIARSSRLEMSIWRRIRLPSEQKQMVRVLCNARHRRRLCNRPVDGHRKTNKHEPTVQWSLRRSVRLNVANGGRDMCVSVARFVRLARVLPYFGHMWKYDLLHSATRPFSIRQLPCSRRILRLVLSFATEAVAAHQHQHQHQHQHRHRRSQTPCKSASLVETESGPTAIRLSSSVAFQSAWYGRPAVLTWTDRQRIGALLNFLGYDGDECKLDNTCYWRHVLSANEGEGEGEDTAELKRYRDLVDEEDKRRVEWQLAPFGRPLSTPPDSKTSTTLASHPLVQEWKPVIEIKMVDPATPDEQLPVQTHNLANTGFFIVSSPDSIRGCLVFDNRILIGRIDKELERKTLVQLSKQSEPELEKAQTQILQLIYTHGRRLTDHERDICWMECQPTKWTVRTWGGGYSMPSGPEPEWPASVHAAHHALCNYATLPFQHDPRYPGLLYVMRPFRTTRKQFPLRPTVATCRKQIPPSIQSFLAAERGRLVLAGGAAVSYAVGSHQPADLDFFFVGYSTEREAMSCMDRFVTHVSFATPPIVARTQHAVTIQGRLPIPSPAPDIKHDYIKCQFILRLYKCTEELLTGFDVDASCLAYDGERLWATPRFRFCVEHQVMVANPHRQSETYAKRLCKYAKRYQLAIWFPGCDPRWIPALKARCDTFRFHALYCTPEPQPAKGLLGCLERLSVGLQRRTLPHDYWARKPQITMSDYGPDVQCHVLIRHKPLTAYSVLLAWNNHVADIVTRSVLANRQVRLHYPHPRPPLRRPTFTNVLVALQSSGAYAMKPIPIDVCLGLTVESVFGMPNASVESKRATSECTVDRKTIDVDIHKPSTGLQPQPFINEYRAQRKPFLQPFTCCWLRTFPVVSTLPTTGPFFRTTGVTDQNTSTFHPTAEAWFHDLFRLVSKRTLRKPAARRIKTLRVKTTTRLFPTIP
jgi:hypothetical protein